LEFGLDDRFSIVMPMYNAAETVSKSVDSVRAQTDPRWELLIVDDCSTDESLNVAQTLAQADARVKVIRLARNSGVAAARNAAIKAAGGRYICFLDSDDFWLPGKLLAQRELFEQGSSVVFGSYYRRLTDGKFSLVKAIANASFRRFDFGNPIGNLTGAYDAQKLGIELQKKCGHEDYIMWREIVRRAGSATSVQEPVAIYTVSASSLSAAKNKAAKWQWDILRKHFGFSLPYAGLAFGFYAFSRVGRRLGEKFTAFESVGLNKVMHL
jgi:teichuronic acid biosynthesis glycosyltransferase TuaG